MKAFDCFQQNDPVILDLEISFCVLIDHICLRNQQKHLSEALCRRRDQNSSHGYSLLLIPEEYVRYNLQIRCSVKESVCWMISECRVHDIKDMQFGVKQSKFSTSGSSLDYKDLIFCISDNCILFFLDRADDIF